MRIKVEVPVLVFFRRKKIMCGVAYQAVCGTGAGLCGIGGGFIMWLALIDHTGMGLS